jgi:hypothetical protein
MEAASLIGLLGLFNNAVEWFEYIQLARGFGVPSRLTFSKSM